MDNFKLISTKDEDIHFLNTHNVVLLMNNKPLKFQDQESMKLIKIINIQILNSVSDLNINQYLKKIKQ
jgi:hypothetical protein